MADLQGYAVMVAETDWGALAYKSATVIGIAAVCYILTIRIMPAETSTGHDYTLNSDTLQQVGSDATSTILRSSTTTHIPATTVTQTVTATADPDKVASSLAKQLLPVLESQIASLKQELIAIQARNFLYMIIGLLLMFLLTSAYWYFFIYRPVYKAFREERDRNTGGRSDYSNMRTTVSLPPAPEDPPNPEESTNDGQRDDHGGLPDEVPTDGEHPKGNGTPLDHTKPGTRTVNPEPAPEQPISEDFADAAHGEEKSTASNSPRQSQPTIEIEASDTPVTAQPLETEESPTLVEGLKPSEGLKNARDHLEAMKVFWVQTRADKRGMLLDLVRRYYGFLNYGSPSIVQVLRKKFDEEQMKELVGNKWAEHEEWVTTKIRVDQKLPQVLKKIVQKDLENHYDTLQQPKNAAQLEIHRENVMPRMLKVKMALDMSATSDSLDAGLRQLEKLVPVRSITEFDCAIRDHIVELNAAEAQMDRKKSAPVTRKKAFVQGEEVEKGEAKAPQGTFAGLMREMNQ